MPIRRYSDDQLPLSRIDTGYPTELGCDLILTPRGDAHGRRHGPRQQRGERECDNRVGVHEEDATVLDEREQAQLRVDPPKATLSWLDRRDEGRHGAHLPDVVRAAENAHRGRSSNSALHRIVKVSEQH